MERDGPAFRHGPLNVVVSSELVLYEFRDRRRRGLLVRLGAVEPVADKESRDPIRFAERQNAQRDVAVAKVFEGPPDPILIERRRESREIASHAACRG